MPTRQSTRSSVTLRRSPCPLMFRYGMVMVSPEPNSQLRQFSSSAGISVVSASADGAASVRQSTSASTSAAACRANRCRCFKGGSLLFCARCRHSFLQCTTGRAPGQGPDLSFHISPRKKGGRTAAACPPSVSFSPLTVLPAGRAGLRRSPARSSAGSPAAPG